MCVYDRDGDGNYVREMVMVILYVWERERWQVLCMYNASICVRVCEEETG